MDNTEKARELINKHLYLHGDIGIYDGDVYRAVLDAVCEALYMPGVMKSVCDHEWVVNTHRKTKYCRKGCDGFKEQTVL